MSLNVVSLFSRAARPRSWSNQELAEFYRVQGSLARAGLEVETEQGLSDEGDPWFVFCRADSGDVVIHFARIDGLYVVASPAFGSCVRGQDFRALIEGLMEQHPVVMPREKDKGKFFIHPAALLVALVTAAFFKLYQGDALAAESRDDHHNSHGGTAGTRNTAASQSHALALDERSAATLMVAVAVAVAWEQVVNPNAQTTVDHQAIEAHSIDLPITIASAEPVVLGSIKDAPSGNAHAVGPLDRAQSVVHDSPTMVAPPVQTMPPLTPESPAASVKLADEQPHISASDAPPVMGSADVGAGVAPPHRMADATPDHANQAQSGGDQHVTAEASNPPASAPAALVEVRAVIGDLVQSHLAADAEATQQFVLSLINANPTIFQVTDVLSVSLDMSKAPSETVDASAAGATTAPFSAGSVTSQTISPVDQAIHEFIVEHADFQIIKLDHEVIMYDPSLTPTNSQYAEQENFTFSDGSSLLLIGLPPHNPASYGFGA
jgi:hypothetical protein